MEIGAELVNELEDLVEEVKENRWDVKDRLLEARDLIKQISMEKLSAKD